MTTFSEVDMMILRVMPGDVVVLKVGPGHNEGELMWLATRFKHLAGLYNNAVLAVEAMDITTVRPDPPANPMDVTKPTQ